MSRENRLLVPVLQFKACMILFNKVQSNAENKLRDYIHLQAKEETMDISGYLAYPVEFIPCEEEGGFTVVLSGLGGVISEGDTKKEATSMIIDAFASMADYRLDRNEIIQPAPEPRGNEELVQIPLNMALKIVLRNGMIRQGISAKELAHRLRMSHMHTSRILNVCLMRTKADLILKALSAIGMDVTIPEDRAR